MRRLLDIAGSLGGALLLSPLIAAIGVSVSVSMGRPILFHQIRSGRGGVPFRMVKFRTMAEMRDGAGRPLPDVVRMTRLGRMLRRTRLDELPELWNVARGDMSLVGPRPLLAETIEEMGSAGLARGAVRPGLTGWAQVNGNALLSDRDKIALDLWYVRHASFALDLAIFLKTVGVVLFGERINADQIRGAYASDRRGRG